MQPSKFKERKPSKLRGISVTKDLKQSTRKGVSSATEKGLPKPIRQGIVPPLAVPAVKIAKARVRPPLDDYGSPSPPPTVEILSLYRWGVFKLGKEAAYVNTYFEEMSYPAMIQGGFKSRAEAEKYLKEKK
jgi:hypothetical protein